MNDPQPSRPAPEPAAAAWHALTVEQTLRCCGVDPAQAVTLGHRGAAGVTLSVVVIPRLIGTFNLVRTMRETQSAGHVSTGPETRGAHRREGRNWLSSPSPAGAHAAAGTHHANGA